LQADTLAGRTAASPLAADCDILSYLTVFIDIPQWIAFLHAARWYSNRAYNELSIDRQEFCRILAEHCNISHQQAELVFKKYDTDGDRKIDRGEFQMFMSAVGAHA
jgi:hypothetical protein